MYKQANYIALGNKINDYNLSSLNTLPLDDAAVFFNESLLRLVSECIPSKEVTVRSDDKPWYDTEIRKHSRKRDRLKSIALKSERTSDWRKYKQARNKVNNLKKYAKERFYNNLELTLSGNYTNNKRDFWKLTRFFIKNTTASASIPPLHTTTIDNEIKIHTTDKDKADCLNDYFTSISRVTDDNVQLPNPQKFTEIALEFFNINELEVKEIIDTLDINKASGPDLINHKMLKYVSSAVSKPLTIIFNRSLREKHYPELWKRNNVVPLFKKGDKDDPANYRPVSLSSSVGKIMERIVFKNMYNHLHLNNLLYKYQSGFVPGHSTTFQLIDIYHHICQTFENKQYSCMVFFDISKAFDRVWHKGLLFKLKQNGIDGNLLDWLADYLSNRKQCVVLNSVCSDYKEVLAGVPQGSVLGPLLFLVYVNDIADQLLSLTRLFADDSSLFLSASNLNDIEGILNHDLSIVSAWAKQWLVNFNPNKTVAMLFSLLKVDVVPSLSFDGIDINFVDQHKHLGITLTENGKWQNHIDNILTSASKVIGIMRKLKYTFSRVALNQVYISYVRPILEYSSVVWDNCTVEQANSLEKLQNEAARIVTGLTRSVSIERLYDECGWDSLSLRRRNQKLKLMYRVTHDMVPSYISDIIPPNVGETTRYPLRNRDNIVTVPQRTTIFSRSCIPSSTSAWNELPLQYRNSETYSAFCYQVKKDFCSSINVPIHYLMGSRKLSILHCRMRNRCSNLNNDLFCNHLRDSPICECLEEMEDAEHFLFKCSLFHDQRIIMFHATRPLHPLNLQLLLYQ
ncbi:MAG: reverse transcriptase family protein [Candidatus Thiodiazotropha taylori]|nr:reverse transcriptase family protein [Candidatus Thiodiazotropha taylori]MCW4333899.1 reverse transcriptase family protein [Candidatus Thiodiazotropha endolucinida]